MPTHKTLLCDGYGDPGINRLTALVVCQLDQFLGLIFTVRRRLIQWHIVIPMQSKEGRLILAKASSQDYAGSGFRKVAASSLKSAKNANRQMQPPIQAQKG